MERNIHNERVEFGFSSSLFDSEQFESEAYSDFEEQTHGTSLCDEPSVFADLDQLQVLEEEKKTSKNL